MLLVIGDWNAKVGEQQLGEEGIAGKFRQGREATTGTTGSWSLEVREEIGH